jgi:hypothetical protein
MTDNELIDAYYEALRRYVDAKASDSNRVEAFVQLASTQMALIGRFGTVDYMRHYCERHRPDAIDLATTAASMHPAAIGLRLHTT